jgi:hypothetical protein
MNRADCERPRVRGPAIPLLLLVASCGGGGGGGASVPQAPSNLIAFAGDGEVLLSWSSVPGADSYTLYWSTVPGVHPGGGSALPNASSPEVHTGLVNGTSYYYAVTASNAQGEGLASAEASAAPVAGGLAVDPSWASVPPLQTLVMNYDPQLSQQQNGAALKSVIQGLAPGTRLEVGAGTWSVNSFFNVSLVGAAGAPIVIAAKPGETPVLTRPDANQNTINFGSSGPARYIAFQGFEVTGGDTAIRLWNCENLWIDSCHIHDCDGVGIEANSVNTAWLTITRNQIHGTSGVGEGIYLGGNFAQVTTHDSVVALNHIYGTGGSQGDGIELKQGSWGNWIVANTVHDTPYPCILAYGTGGMPPNLIERNTCYNSGDNVMQVQGEAIVRNNLLINGATAFHSGDHQGTVRDLTVVHNTMINTGRAVNLSNWSGKPNMVFANNIAYSQGDAVRINGSTGVEFIGNVAFGSVAGVGSGWISGGGLSDFVDLTWDAAARDATPLPSSAIAGAGDYLWSVPSDITGAARTDPLDSGCFDAP